MDAVASGYDHQDIRERLETIYDKPTADGQLELVRPILARCTEDEESHVRSVYRWN